jgi:hypothetical protein
LGKRDSAPAVVGGATPRTRGGVTVRWERGALCQEDRMTRLCRRFLIPTSLLLGLAIWLMDHQVAALSNWFVWCFGAFIGLFWEWIALPSNEERRRLLDSDLPL